MTKPSHDDLNDQVAAFLLKGGAINEIDEGQRALHKSQVHTRFNPLNKVADEFTERSMRSAENQEGVESAYYGR
jgi:hypothetical protein